MIRSVGYVRGEASSVEAVAGQDGHVRLVLRGRHGAQQSAITLFGFDARSLGEGLISESVIAGMARREGGEG